MLLRIRSSEGAILRVTTALSISDFFSQIINQSALVLANQSTAVFDGDFLAERSNEQSAQQYQISRQP